MSDTIATAAPATTPAPAPAAVEINRVTQLSDLGMKEFAQFANIPQPDAQAEAATVAELASQAVTEAVAPETDGIPDMEEGITAEEFAAREAGVEGETEGTAEPEPVEVQDERYVTPKVVDRKLATEFSVKDGDVEIEVPELSFTYKVGGKEVTDPIDVLVRKAQQGGYNEALQTEVHELRTQFPQIQQQLQKKEQQLTQLQAGMREMLASPETYLAEHEKYQAQNTPESQLQAANRRIQEMEQQRVQEADTQQAKQFSESLMPRLDALTTSHPEVSFDEAFGRLNILIAPYLVQGRVPPQYFPQIAQLVDAQLLPWVEATAQTRREQFTQQKLDQIKPLTAQVSAAQAEKNAAKRQLTRALKPQGTAAPSSPKPVSIKTATDIMSEIGKIALAG